MNMCLMMSQHAFYIPDNYMCGITWVLRTGWFGNGFICLSDSSTVLSGKFVPAQWMICVVLKTQWTFSIEEMFYKLFWLRKYRWSYKVLPRAYSFCLSLKWSRLHDHDMNFTCTVYLHLISFYKIKIQAHVEFAAVSVCVGGCMGCVCVTECISCRAASDSRFYDISDPSSNRVRSIRHICEVFWVKTCADSLSVWPTPVYIIYYATA